MKYIIHIMQHRPKAMLFLLFFVTVLIRIPQLTRPLSKHHELNTAAVLICISTWNEHGIGMSNGAPLHMFAGPYNIFKNPATRYPRLLESGSYLSMGPLSYIMPWAIFKLLHIKPTEISIRLFTLLLGLISFFLFYILVKQVFSYVSSSNNNSNNTVFLSDPYYHFMGLVFFAFSPALLWYMGNAYCHEVLVLPFYLTALIAGFKIINSGYRATLKNYVLYGAAMAAAVYTDWLGCVMAFVFFVQAISVKKMSSRLPFLLVNAGSACIPVVFIVWQYSSVIGFAEYKNFFVEQLFHRRLPDGGVTYSVIDFIKHFITGYGLFFLAAIAAIVFGKVKWNRYLVILCCIPLMHYLLFRGFNNEHDYAVLKWAPFVIIWCVFYLLQLREKLQLFVAVTMVVSNLFLYEYINPPGTQSFNGYSYASMKKIGETVAKEAKPDTYIFINTPSYFYQIAWYARRNYLNVDTETEARLWLTYQPGNKGIFFMLNDSLEPVKVIHINK